MKKRTYLQAMEEDTIKWAGTMGIISVCHIFIRYWYKEWNPVTTWAVILGFIILVIMFIITIKLKRKQDGTNKKSN